MAASSSAASAVAWKHIGLHNHSVGTLILDISHLTWKSAVTGASDIDAPVMTKRISAKLISSAQWTVFGRMGYLRVGTKPLKGGDENESKSDKKQSLYGTELRLDGFPEKDFGKLQAAFKKLYNVEVTRKNISSCGASFGTTDIVGRNLVFRESNVDADEEGEAESGEEITSLDLAEVSQCVLPGNNRNEIELQFHESDTVEQGTDQLVQIRFYIPPDPDTDPTDRDTFTAAELFQQRITTKANIKETAGNVICQFDETKGTFLTPRGRYTIELYDNLMRLRGNKYDYKIKYDDVSRLFLLPNPNDFHMAFVIALDKPIRQGQQRYQYLVMQTTKNQAELSINLDEETIKKEYNGDLQPKMVGSLSNLVAKTFKVVTRKKVFVPGKFANANQHACVKCALRANDGHLYPLEKQFLFIHKPCVLIRFDEVESVEFQRYAGGQGSTRNFDLCVTLLNYSGDDADKSKEYTFSGIDRSDYAALYSFLSGKKIKIKNLQGGIDESTGKPLYNENDIFAQANPALAAEAAKAGSGGEGGGMMEESSEDEDYESPDSESSESINQSDATDDDDDMSDSDLEEARQRANKIAKKRKAEDPSNATSKSDKTPPKPNTDQLKKKKKKSSSSDSVSPKVKPKKPPAPEPTKKKGKPKKDPNAPKKALSSYVIFANAKRAEIKKSNPEATFGDIAKLIGAEFKKLSDSDKQKWTDLASKDKVRYQKDMEDYEPPSDMESVDTGKPKRKKVKKDPNAPKKPLSSFMIFCNENRPKIKEANPDAGFGDIAKLMGAEFKKLSEQERKRYDELVLKEKEKYKIAMEKYEMNGGDQRGEKDEKPMKKKKPVMVKKEKKKVQKKESSSEASDSDDESSAADSSGDSDSDDTSTDSD